MATARYGHTATLLPDGRVLVAGGSGSISVIPSAEIYDPATGTWSETGSMATARYLHTATLLPDGRVLVAGGFGYGGVGLTSAEIYDPATGAWSDTGSMATGRWYHTATLLPDGRVLVAGGQDGNGGFASAEIYDPATGTWSETGSMSTIRITHTATLLPDGRVLVAGGTGAGDLASAEIYDPATGVWATTGNMATTRYGHSATLLPDGRVLVAGGGSGSGPLPSAEVYDPATGVWATTGNMATGRVLHTATLLPDGQVLVAGGQAEGDRTTASAELYEPTSPIIPPPPTISVTDIDVLEGNSGTTTAPFVVTLSANPSSSVSVRVKTANQTATGGADYVALPVTTLTWNPGDPLTKTVNVTVNGDTMKEGSETFLLKLSSPSGATVADPQGTGTIIDEEGRFFVSVSDAAVVEGDSGPTTMDFNVALSAGPDTGQRVTVTFVTADGTATAGSDYVALASTALTWNPGDALTKTVAITVNGDTTVEPDETLFLNLSSPSKNAVLSDTQGIGTILHDD